MATGETYKSLISRQRSVCIVIMPGVYDAIIDNFMDEYMSLPGSEDKWLSLANEYEKKG